jgi:hypothetical protein
MPQTPAYEYTPTSKDFQSGWETLTTIRLAEQAKKDAVMADAHLVGILIVAWVGFSIALLFLLFPNIALGG